ncbi:hypothetical protein JWG41_13920 [Leptospira sp. 201903075]|uniref:hypothetical protein n=1 Tax=Leptospira chreensis TaxID=2810035 RepID=UPI0019662705|nr:hypothetical protein [Leptospira chreensis]MBM9591550.1 hypothetical protein [Leptospira chreensis]
MQKPIVYSRNFLYIIKRINFLFIFFLSFITLNCKSTRHNFEISSVIKKNNIKIQFDEIVIHFDFQLPTSNKNRSTSYHLEAGIVEQLKNCNIVNKNVSVYTGFFQFLNYITTDKKTLTNNFLKENPKRIDIHLISLDTKKTLDHSDSNKKYNQNFELYFYSRSNPLIHYNVLETRYEEPFNLNKNELKDHFNFGATFGKSICDSIKEL